MFEKDFETSATPHIAVTECLGNLVVQGTKERQVTVRSTGAADGVTLEQEGESFTVAARADCILGCPPATTLTVGQVQGNAKIDRVAGPLTVAAVQGNLSLRAVGPASVEQISGNLSVRQMDGSLQVQMLRGGARVREVEGPVALGQIHGRLTAEGLRGGLEAERVMGNVRLGPPFSPGLTYRLTSDGNLTVYLPEDAGLQLALRAGGRVRSQVPGLVLEEVDGQHKGSLAGGEAVLEARVSGWISLRPAKAGEKPVEEPMFEFAGDIESLGTQIEARVARAIAEMETRLAENLGHVDSEEVGRWANEKAERARRAAEQEAERARLRAERAERRWRRASGRRTRPRRAQATDEERMQVLRLVETGKITPEQASDLLAALNGR